MNKIKITQFISLFFVGLFFISVHIVYAEFIRDFNSTITVLPDSSIVVNEKISYDFEKSIRHGIFRTIPLLDSKSEPMQIEVVSVTDGDDNAYKFTTDITDGIFNIKIGDPDKMISGIKEYDISYRVLGSIAYYPDFDEIYWNVTGNNWQVPIRKVEARVVLPTNVFPTRQACYYGPIGSKTTCKTTTESNIYTPEVELKANEGLTVAVGFPKGTVLIYHPKIESPIWKFVKTFWPIVIPIIVFIFMFRKWFKKGRDPKGTGVIIPQYDVPDNLTPLEVGGIINEEVKNQNISAEIIYLAICGYLKIKQIDKKILGFTAQHDYEFTLLKEEGLLLNDFDKEILTAIFEHKGKVGGTSKLSELKNGFYQSIQAIDDSVVDTLLSKKYYTNLPKFKATLKTILPLVYVGMAVFLFSGFGPSLFLPSIISSIIVWLIFNHLMPAKSARGVATKEYLLGLKEYLQIAEKDRLNFHNAPLKKPEIFETLLPYAMVFGVEQLWAKEFKDIYTNSPEWYEGGSSNFNVVNFGYEMALFNTFATSSLSSSPTSGGMGGSGGGGFSGGGGGGGGGGSW